MVKEVDTSIDKSVKHSAADLQTNELVIKKEEGMTEVKNASAAGSGALSRSDEQLTTESDDQQKEVDGKY